MAQITKTALKKLIMEEVSRINKTKELESKKAQIEKELKALNESDDMGMAPAAPAPVSEAQFTPQNVLDPNMPQPMAEGMDPGIMQALSAAINWLQASSPSQVGMIPNAALLSGPALLALSGLIAGAEKAKQKLMASKKATPAPAPAAPAAPGV